MSDPLTYSLPAGRDVLGPAQPPVDLARWRDVVLALPGGRTLRPARSRWLGVLDAEELQVCRTRGVPVAYDCAQCGWVPAACSDEHFDVAELPAAAPSPAPAADASAGTVRARDAAWWVAQRRHRSTAVASGLPPAARPAAPLAFRPWTLADVDTYRTLLDDPELWRHLPEPFPGPITTDTARTLLEVSAADPRQEIVAVLLDGQPIGQCLLRHGEPAPGVHLAEVAYWLGRPWWGRGLMSTVLAQFVARAFATGRLDAIFAWIHAEHRASQKVAERCGFQRDHAAHVPELAASMRRPSFWRYVAWAPRGTRHGV
jgi:RimJ/RimL family protein N-acetyltransferase